MGPSIGDYAVGLLFLGVTLAGAIAAGAFVVRRFGGELRSLPRALALFLVTTLALVWAHMIPGALGILSRESAALTAVALAGLVALAARGPAGRDVWRPLQPPRLTVEAAVALALVGVASLALLIDRAATPITAIDALTFHLPVVGGWMQQGSMWPVFQFTPDLANGNYPQNGDVALLAAVLPFDNDAFVRLVNVPFLLVTGGAVYALGRLVGASSASSAVGAALLLSVPSVLEPALLQGQTDIFMLATFASGLVFLVRHHVTRLRSDLVLAGIGLGLAFGTKWYAVSTVAIVVGVWLAGGLVAELRGPAAARRIRLLGSRALLLAGVIALTGGFWLLRNLVESGNPLFPQPVRIAGLTLFDAPPDRIREASGFAVSHYLLEGAVWRDYLLPAFSRSLALPALLLIVVGAAAAAPALRSRTRPGSRLVLTGWVCALLLLGAYAVTPYTAFGPEGAPILAGANTRYAVPALLVAAPLAAWLLDRLGRWRLVLAWIALVAIVDGVARAGEVRAGAAIAAVLLLAGGLAAGLLLRRRPFLAISRSSAGVTLVGILAVAVVAGAAIQDRFNDGRYLGLDPTYDWVLTEAPAGSKVGLAGRWPVEIVSPVWPLFGPRVDNEVRYVGELRQEMLREIERRRPFQRRLAEDGYELLLLGRGDSAGAEGAGAERRWAMERGWRPVTASPYFTLLRAPNGS